MKKLIFAILSVGLLVFVAIVWAGTVSEQPYGWAFPKWYSYSGGAASDYYLEHPTLTGNDQVVSEDATQTLTNKTLISPTITGPTITSAGALSFNTVTYAFGSTDHQDDIDVSGVSMIFLDSSEYAITIGGLDGGVAGQQLFLSVIDATETITIENDETTGEQKLMLDGAGDVTLNVNEGMHLVCDGTNWWEINR